VAAQAEPPSRFGTSRTGSEALAPRPQELTSNHPWSIQFCFVAVPKALGQLLLLISPDPEQKARSGPAGTQ
jgi:hypothetical protein